jgi:hypothetical protein
MKSFLLLFLFAVSAQATSLPVTRVRANLSQLTTGPGEPVELKIEVVNGHPAGPPNVSADGLKIEYSGQSTRLQNDGGQISITTFFSYTIISDHEGSFVIPPIRVAVGPNSYQTSALTLRVLHRDAGKTNPTASDKPYFGELIIPRESAFVGEAVPIELRFYFDARVWYEPYPQGQYPIIDGDGFVTTRYPEPVDKMVEIDGKAYHVLIYRSALVGAHAGELTIRSAYQEFLVQLPASRNWPPNPDELLDPLNGFERKDIKVETGGATVKIRPLPDSGRPVDFSGAVGTFSLESSIQPSAGKVGEPLEFVVSVKGLGNFDRVQAPSLNNSGDWLLHGPSVQTDDLDDVGLNAVKEFRYTIVPARSTDRGPEMKFSFFDPTQEKYVTVTSPVAAVRITGAALYSTSPSPETSGTPGGQSSSAANDTTDSKLYNLSTFTPANFGFVPRGFWWWQIGPALVLLALVAQLWRGHRVGQNTERRRLEIERRRLRRQLNRSESKESLRIATRLVEIDFTLRHSALSSILPLEEIVRLPDLTPELRTKLDDLLRKRDEAFYSGRTSDYMPPSREELKATIRAWEAAA